VNPISISTAPINRLIGKPYYDLHSTIEVMQRLWQESVVDGFEFQNLAEWDRENPPRDDDEQGNRLAAWTESLKYTTRRRLASTKRWTLSGTGGDTRDC